MATSYDISDSNEVVDIGGSMQQDSLLDDCEPVDAVHSVKSRFRTQTGTLVRGSDGFYCRYMVDGIGASANGEFKRKKIATWLCPLETDVIDRSRLMKKFMAGENARQKGAERVPPSADDLTVGRFWETKHLPLIKEERSWATHRTYERLWHQYLQPHFAGRALRRYRTVDGNEWLTSLVKGEGRTRNGERRRPLNSSSYGLVRSIASGIFTHAINVGILDVNPFANVRLMVRVKEHEQGEAYTIEEVAAILAALDKLSSSGPALFFALCVQGLRPSEVAGLRLGQDIDIARGVLHIRRSCPSGHAQESAKNLQSKAPIPLSEVVAERLTKWQAECGRTHGYVFERRGNQPVDSGDYARRFIQPVAEKVIGEGRWMGLYACRRFAATETSNLTGNTLAAYTNLRNSKKTTDKHYLTPSSDQGRKGQHLLDAAIKGKMTA
jgi:integrase